MFFLNQSIVAIKTAWRNLHHNWLYGSLNILGLSIAYATLILVAAYIFQERTYESFYSLADRIYRPTYHVKTGSGFEIHFARIPESYINELPEEIPEIEKLIRFQNQEQKYFRIGQERFKPKHAYVTDADVFEVFDWNFIAGDPATALLEPYSAVLTRSTAIKYFSNINVLDEEIVIVGDWTPEEKSYRITGIIEDLPVNTHLPVETLLSFTNEEERSGWAYVYTLLSDNTDISEVEAKMPAFVGKRVDPESTTQINYEFQALRDIHLNSNLAREIKPNGQILYLRIFFWVALFVWIIALVNFANLSTALSMNRGKEMGVRKVLGASRRQLVIITLAETLLYSLFALIIGAIIAKLCFPVFSNLTGVHLLPPLEYLVPALLLMALFSGLLAGVLPSIVVTSVEILQILKKGRNWSLKSPAGNFTVRQVILSLQFCATIVLLASAMMAQRQFKFIREKNLGLNQDQIITIANVPDKVTGQYNRFKNLVQQIPGVSGVTACMQVPSSEIRDVGPVLVKGVNENPSQAPMMDMQILDPDFVEMMNLSFMAGGQFQSTAVMKPVPEFTEEFSAVDYLNGASREYLINETAMKQLGWSDPQEAIGKEINWSIGGFELAYGPIKGVVKDFHQESLKNSIDPTVMVVEPIWLRSFLIKVETSKLDQTLAGIEKVWSGLFPYALEFAFLDEMFNRLYHQDRIQLRLLHLLSLLAIFISFIGLIGLVAFALRTRAKEMAIRRVIGADLNALTLLIGKEYFRVLAVAAVFGVPLSYFGVSRWLENFAYHVKISPLVFVLAVVLVYLLLLLGIYLQTLKATRDNPVDSLKEQ